MGIERPHHQQWAMVGATVVVATGSGSKDSILALSGKENNIAFPALIKKSYKNKTYKIIKEIKHNPIQNFCHTTREIFPKKFFKLYSFL